MQPNETFGVVEQLQDCGTNAVIAKDPIARIDALAVIAIVPQRANHPEYVVPHERPVSKDCNQWLDCRSPRRSGGAC